MTDEETDNTKFVLAMRDTLILGISSRMYDHDSKSFCNIERFQDISRISAPCMFNRASALAISTITRIRTRQSRVTKN